MFSENWRPNQQEFPRYHGFEAPPRRKAWIKVFHVWINWCKSRFQVPFHHWFSESKLQEIYIDGLNGLHRTRWQIILLGWLFNLFNSIQLTWKVYECTAFHLEKTRVSTNCFSTILKTVPPLHFRGWLHRLVLDYLCIRFDDIFLQSFI